MDEQFAKQEAMVPPTRRPSVGGYLRAVLRLGSALAYTMAFSLLARLIYPVVWIAPGRAKALRSGLSRVWMHGLLRFTGTRIIVQGKLPAKPYCLVFNHPNWLDFFALTALLDARFVAEAPLKTAPIVGILFRGLDLLFVKRTQEDTPRITHAVIEASRAGDSVAFAPENPVLDTPRGTVVRPFRAALFEAAVQTGTPVACASVSYRTPAGCPSAIHSVIFHTPLIYRAPGSDLSDKSLESYGTQKVRDFFRYLIGMLALPYHEIIITFAEETLTAEDRITLANKAHAVVSAMFVPVE